MGEAKQQMIRKLLAEKCKYNKFIGTYVDNDDLFFKSIYFKPDCFGLYPHEVAFIETLYRCRADALNHPVISNFSGMEYPSKCVSSLIERGFVVFGVSKDDLKKFTRIELGQICKKMNLKSKTQQSREYRELIAEYLENSDQIISDFTDIGFYRPSDEKGKQVIEYYNERLVGPYNHLTSYEEIFSNVFPENVMQENSDFIRGLSREWGIQDTEEQKKIGIQESEECEEKIWELKKDRSNLDVDGKLLFYVHLDSIMETYIAYYFPEYEKIHSIYRDEDTYNYRIKVKKEDIERIGLVLFLLRQGIIKKPQIYNTAIEEVLYAFCSDGYGISEATKNVAKKLSICDEKSRLRFLKKLSRQYPVRIFLREPLAYIYASSLDREDWKDIYYNRIYNNDKHYRGVFNDQMNELAENGFINKRWKNEFNLYLLLKAHFDDCKYQYHAKWLGNQSLDVYIPQIRTAVEYQGEQHYRPISLFGGKDEFLHRVELDAQKKEKCKENNVRLIEWKYDIEVTAENLKRIMSEYGIKLPKVTKEIPLVKLDKNSNNDFAKRHEVETRIYQYDNNGNYVAEYATINEAELAVGSHGVGKVIRGQQKNAAGYFWRKVDVGTPHEGITVSPEEFQPKYNLSGKSKCVGQFDREGNLLNTYTSVSEASRVVGVNTKSIRLVLKGVQKQAGGYQWKEL